MTRLLMRSISGLILALLCGCSGSSSQQRWVIAQHSPPPDSVLWRQLNVELAEQLQAQEVAGTLRTASSPPTDTRSRVVLVAQGDMGEGQAQLSWLYSCAGDYDQNGEVNAADLVPLVAHYLRTGPFPANSAEALVDGDGNNEINAADITPIASNFRVQVQGFNLYSSESLSDYPESAIGESQIQPLTSFELTEGQGDHAINRLSFAYEPVVIIQDQYYWVRPTDGVTEGIASEPVGYPSPVLAVELIGSPASGTIPLEVEFTARVLDDPSGHYYYAWDFDNDGFFDRSGMAWEFATEQYMFTEPGSHRVLVRAGDTLTGASGEAHCTIQADIPSAD